jgi:exopolysaccharide biosynthesis polyprenyl glycosylphosphotransferase
MARPTMKMTWQVLLEIVIDIALVTLGFVLAYWIRYELQWPAPVAAENYIPFRTYIPMAAIMTVLLMSGYGLQKVYAHQRGRNWLDEAYALLNGTTTGTLLMIVITYFVPALSYSRTLFPLAALTILSLLVMSRIAKNIALDQLRKRGIGIKQILVVGAGEIGRTVMRTIAAHPELGYRVAGFVDDDSTKAQTDLGRIKALGNIDNIPEIIRDASIDYVIITLPWMYHRKILRIVRQCEQHSVQAYIVPDLLQTTISRVGIEHIGEVPMISVRAEPISRRGQVAKRIVDIVGATLGLGIGSPILLLSALAIKLGSPGPIIFKQTRLSQYETPFTCFKFRTMYQDAEAAKEKLIEQNNADRRLFKMKDDPRITGVGRILRRFSIDEMPQFFNVLRGDMSLVGPRPPVPSEVELYLEWHRHKLDVPAGITGMWQISGRSDLSFDEGALLDIWYAENWSLLLDFKIMLKTAAAIILGKGAY